VQVNTTITLDLRFEVGHMAETIEGRNVVDLLSLQPGVIKTDAGGDERSGAMTEAVFCSAIGVAWRGLGLMPSPASDQMRILPRSEHFILNRSSASLRSGPSTPGW
jgi:hypothetical protein